MALTIKSKAIHKHSCCTVYGFVYDDRKIKAEWLAGEKDEYNNKGLKMLSDVLKEKIETQIEDKVDFNEMMNGFKMSSADLEVRQEAMNYLKAQYPQYDEVKHIPTKEILQAIKDGEADIDDINGF